MKTGMRFIIQPICCLALAVPSWATPSVPSSPHIKILSQQMDCDQSQNVCVATGNAVAQKLGDPQTKILKADKITTYFAKEGEKGSLKLVRLEAEGNVFFIIGDIVVQGDQGNYAATSEVAEVFGSVKITNGKNQLNGSYGKVFMTTGHYTIKRDGAPVQALIFESGKAGHGSPQHKR